MRLGLVRHFKVVTNEKYFLNSEEFSSAMANYDKAPITKNELSIDSKDWDICYCSTLPRAVTTAESIYTADIIKSDLLVEVPISPFTERNIKLPAFIWHIASRIAWYRSHVSQMESIHDTKERINEFYEILQNSGYERILIVSHGYFLRMFYEELKKKGFRGEVDINILNGKLYVIEK
jgi:broad specificity phosphatase PhoE